MPFRTQSDLVRNRAYVRFNAKTGLIGVVRIKDDGTRELRDDVVRLDNVRLVSIRHEQDEYEGNPYEKLVIDLAMDSGTAEETNLRFSANLETAAAARFVAALCECALDRPFDIVARSRRAGSQYKRKDGTLSEPLERDVHDLLVFQEQRCVIGERPPASKETMLGRKTVWDNSERVAWAIAKTERVAERLKALGLAAPQAPAHAAATEEAEPVLDDAIPF